MSDVWAGRKVSKLSQFVLSEKGNICHLCGESIIINELVNEFSLDHYIARSKGGTDELSNLFPSHKSCNYSRGNMSVEQFKASTTNELRWWMKLEA